MLKGQQLIQESGESPADAEPLLEGCIGNDSGCRKQ